MRSFRFFSASSALLLGAAFFSALPLTHSEPPSTSLVGKTPMPTKAVWKEDVALHAGWSTITVVSRSFIPTDISDVARAHELAKESAVAMAQEHLMAYVFTKKTHSGKTLAYAAIPSLELQNRVRVLISETPVTHVEWKSDSCQITLTLDKAKLNKILRDS